MSTAVQQYISNKNKAVVFLVKASYLILPWDGDTASGKLRVKIIVCLVQVDTLNGGELLNVQNIFTVDSPGLWNQMR